MSDESVKLLPCPFCGAPGMLEHMGGPGSTHRIAKCSKCRCDMHWHPTVEAAITAWNTREPSDQRGIRNTEREA